MMSDVLYDIINSRLTRTEIIKDLVEYLEAKKSSMLRKYMPIEDKYYQSWHFERDENNNIKKDESGNRIKILEYNDDGTPKMEQEWGDVDIELSDLDNEDKMKYNSYEDIESYLVAYLTKGDKK